MVRDWEEIYRYIATRVRDRYTAEELTQETFIRALRSEDHIEGQVESIVAYLKVIARNLVVNQWRKDGKRHPFMPLDTYIANVNEPSVLLALCDRELQEEVIESIHHLPVDQQTVLHHRLWLDRSIKETAAIMEKPEGTIKALQHRAIKAVRDRIQRHEQLKGGLHHGV